MRLFRAWPGFKAPRFKLYQQIIIYFVIAVLLPLMGVSILIYNINQKALKKELVKFTEHTAETLFNDINSMMDWQDEQQRVVSAVIQSSFLSTQRSTQRFNTLVKRVEHLVPHTEYAALYNGLGKQIQTVSLTESARIFNTIAPKTLPVTKITHVQFALLYLEKGDYYLQIVHPILQHSITRGYVVFYKRFDPLTHLVKSYQKTLYNGFYMIDSAGHILKGPGIIPTTIKQQDTANSDILQHFQHMTEGVSLAEDDLSENDTVPNVDKVLVKLPALNVGIVIESPYHVRQKFIKRARNQTLMLMGATFILIIVLAITYVLGINRNFRQLIKGIKAVAEGNYSRRIRLITNSATPVEIVVLAGEFNRMARQLSEAWEESQVLNQELRTANEQLAKLDDLKSNLIDTVSHELRTPLTSIKGYTSRLIRYDQTLDTDTRIKSLKVIKQQADRLTRLVDDLLVIPDLETGGIRVFPDHVALFPALESAVQFIQQKEHRDIISHLPTNQVNNADMTVLADPDRLEQVLLNLLDNAVKYSISETPIDLYVESPSPNAVGMHFIRIRIQNQSEYLPENSLNTLFEKFKRLDDTMTRTTRGSGLGLFITKGLVEAMGGEIQLLFDPVYSRFEATFTLPFITGKAISSETNTAPTGVVDATYG